MKKIVFVFMVAILATSCQAQEDSYGNYALNETHKNSVKPRGQWKVNKEIDERGNIIRYDSIYSWSSSNEDMSELHRMNPDSLMAQMQERMRSSFGITGRDPFAGFFGSDSTRVDPFMNNFFDEDPAGMFPDMNILRERMQNMLQQQLMPMGPKPLIPAVPEEKREQNSKASLKRTI